MKIVTKTIASRIKLYLSKLVHEDQTGFVKGRQIRDNIRATLDILNATDHYQIPGAIVLLDIEKAFDSLEWKYMFSVLRKFNFGETIIKWLATFYENRESRVLNNGHMSESIYLERGVFQGCPLSPYLFLLCIEPLAASIRQNEQIRGIQVGNVYKKIGLFADDATVFTEGDEHSLT